MASVRRTIRGVAQRPPRRIGLPAAAAAEALQRGPNAGERPARRRPGRAPGPRRLVLGASGHGPGRRRGSLPLAGSSCADLEEEEEVRAEVAPKCRFGENSILHWRQRGREGEARVRGRIPRGISPSSSAGRPLPRPLSPATAPPAARRFPLLQEVLDSNSFEPACSTRRATPAGLRRRRLHAGFSTACRLQRRPSSLLFPPATTRPQPPPREQLECFRRVNSGGGECGAPRGRGSGRHGVRGA